MPFPQARVRTPNLGVRCNKWFNWTSGVGVGWKNPTSSVLKNPTPTPPKNPRLLATPTPQPCLQWRIEIVKFFCYIPQENKFWKPLNIRKLKLFPFRIHIKCNFLSSVSHSLQCFSPSKPGILLNVEESFVISIDLLYVLVKLFCFWCK